MLALLLGTRGGLRPCGTLLVQSVVECEGGSGYCLAGAGSHASNRGEETPLEGAGGGDVEA